MVDWSHGKSAKWDMALHLKTILKTPKDNLQTEVRVFLVCVCGQKSRIVDPKSRFVGPKLVKNTSKI